MEASHIHNSEGVAPGPCELSVHGKPQPSTNVHWDHQPARPSPSLPLQERAGEKRPIGIWLLEFFWDLELGIWSFPRPVHGDAAETEFAFYSVFGAFSRSLRLFDQVPELWILLQRFILLHLQTGTEEKILQCMAAQDSMDHQAQFVPLEIDAIIADSKPLQNSAGSFQLAELIDLCVHDLLR